MACVSRGLGSLLLAACVLTACGPTPASESIAREHVVDVFQAIQDRNCETARRLMPTITDQAGCDDFFEDARAHRLELLEVLDAQPDGRNPRAVIVRCRVRMEGDERVMLVRAEERESGWAVMM